jgi:hypothetical protein
MTRSALFGLLLCPAMLFAQNPQLSPDAPKDKPNHVESSRLSAFEAAIAPHVAHAKQTYPDAKRRFLAGLSKGQSFFVTTRLRDGSGAFEQVFIAVRSIEGGTIRGRIWSEVTGVRGYHYGDAYAFPETDLLDWTIAHPDGTEEGNEVGKFLDTYQVR